MKAGASPVWVSSRLVCPLVGYVLLLVLVQFLCSGIISAPGGSIGFSAFAVVCGRSVGAQGGVSFSGISRSGTACDFSTSLFFFGSSVVFITAFASLN